MFFVGFFYSSLAVVLSIWVFKPHASLVMVFLTVIACVPLMYGTIKLEEKKDIDIGDERKLLKEHGRALMRFVFLFVGIVRTDTLWYQTCYRQTISSRHLRRLHSHPYQRAGCM